MNENEWTFWSKASLWVRAEQAETNLNKWWNELGNW
jgi:hypothetical protein